ncbi:MAG: SH3 domain-containing protein [Lachnospiraceae bacterium]|jgi:N-acetylmuramoyl-L-alanine amidase|nr:SH3 domain-containing protein [Lachnospiraceae bacterium]
MKILLVSGHTSGDNACRATGVNEGDLAIELTKKLRTLLSPYADVDAYPYERDMYKDNKNGCLKVNLKDYRYIFEVHFNSGGGAGRGTSVQIHSAYQGGISVEQAIVNNVASLGFKKRGTGGIVRRDDLLNMNTALKLGVDYALIETCFYDNAADMALYRQNKEAVAQAIARGIVDGFGLKTESGGTSPVQPVKRTVTVFDCTALNVRKTPNGPVVAGTVKAGTVLEVTGSGKDSDGDTWLQVRHGSLTGYVWPKYVK